MKKEELLVSNNQILFTDGSVNTKTKVGYGAYLLISEKDLSANLHDVKTKRFENSSSTKLELQTLLWALNQISNLDAKTTVYTDSQNIVGLLARRTKLEKNNYLSGKGKLLANYELYKEFYKLTDTINCEFIKIAGHKATKQKDDTDKLFTLVDRASRKALREYYK